MLDIKLCQLNGKIPNEVCFSSRLQYYKMCARGPILVNIGPMKFTPGNTL